MSAIPKLINLRTRAGFHSSSALAKHLTVNRNTVDHWERGRHLPSLLTAERWAAALRVDLQTLAGILREATKDAPAVRPRRNRLSPRHPSRSSASPAPGGGAPSSRGSR